MSTKQTKKLMVLCVIVWAIVIMAAGAKAETVEINWGYPAENEANIQGFKIWKITGNTKIEMVTDIAPGVRAWEFDDAVDPQCSNYGVTATNSDGLTDGFISNAAAVCPDDVLPGVTVRSEAPTNAQATIIINVTVQAPPAS